jgi:hypothetical protein
MKSQTLLLIAVALGAIASIVTIAQFVKQPPQSGGMTPVGGSGDLSQSGPLQIHGH